MTVEELEHKWSRIKAPKTSSYSYQRIDSICIPEVRIGISYENKNRCLILKLSENKKIDINEEKENLKIYFDINNNSIVLELKDPFYNIFFIDLVVSLYNKIKSINIEDVYTELFINTVRNWSDFLKSKRGLLSEEIIQGIYGELVYLEHIINTTNTPINKILNSWKGPYDYNHDFHFDDINVEVKTRQKNVSSVSISSEFQLKMDNEKKLDLTIITVSKVDKKGDNLFEILNRLRKIIIRLGGDISILSNAINEKRIDFLNANNYDDIQFKLESIRTYDCSHQNFPKIVNGDIPEALFNVRYKILISSLDDFTKEIIENEY